MMIDATPKQTSTDRIEAVLNQLIDSEPPAVRAERLRRELRTIERQSSDDEAKPTPTNGTAHEHHPPELT